MGADRLTIERDRRLHPVWCTHDDVSLPDEHVDDAFVWYHGDEVELPTDRETTITLRLKWWESVSITCFDSATPSVEVSDDDGRFSWRHPIQGEDTANVAIAVAALSHQMTTAGRCTTAEEAIA